MKEKEIEVLVVGTKNMVAEATITNDLKTMQEIVEGYIEAFYPFDDNVCVICNEEGKINGMTPNRPLLDNGQLVDIIFGRFMVVGFKGGDFVSLTEKQKEYYGKMFDTPYEFVSINGRVVPIPLERKKAAVGDYIRIIDMVGAENYNGRCGKVTSVLPGDLLLGTWGGCEITTLDRYEIVNEIPNGAIK